MIGGDQVDIPAWFLKISEYSNDRFDTYSFHKYAANYVLYTEGYLRQVINMALLYRAQSPESTKKNNFFHIPNLFFIHLSLMIHS